MAPEPGPTDFLWTTIILLLLLLLLTAILTTAEIGIINLSDSQIKKLTEEGNPQAGTISKLTKHSGRFLGSVRLGIGICEFFAAGLASWGIAPFLENALFSLGLPQNVAFIFGFVLTIFLLVFLFLLFGEAIPKKFAPQRIESSAYRYAGFLKGLILFLKPMFSLISSCTHFAMRMGGLDPNHEDSTVTEEEILMMVDQGEEKGVIAEDAKDMISNIFDFDDSTVAEAMTHRTDIIAVEDTDTIQDVVNLAIQEGFSRIPVYHEDLDNILGIIYVKDLLKYVGAPVDQTLKLTKLMRLAHFVPETNKCSELFKEMTENHFQIAVIVDEYGGTEGLISLEDLLESIVGNIQDEYDREEEEVIEEGANCWNVDGSIAIDDVEDLTGITLPRGDYDTLAGLLVELLGRIPNPDEQPCVKYGMLTFTALRVEERRITRIRIRKKVFLQETTGKSSAKSQNKKQS
jgi:putative hemolysin